MANKEILGLEIEVDNIELDKTEKKLRSLDKLLQQTQRRASVLGKTKIAPKISLDDRFSSAAEKIKRTLSQLQRAKVRPVVQLADHVSATVARITGSLIGMSAKPWRVAVEAVDWDTAIGGSFSNWMSAEGANTLQRISSSIGAALGSGLKDVMMGALGLADPPKEMVPRRRIDFVEEDRKLLMDQNESPYAEAGRKAGGIFFRAFLGMLDSQKVSARLSMGNEGAQSYGHSGSRGNFGKRNATSTGSGKVWNWIGGFGIDIGEEYFKGEFENFGDDYLKAEGKKFTEAWKNSRGAVNSKQHKFIDSVKDGLKSTAKNGSKVAKNLGWGPTGLILDAAEIASAKSGRERAETIGGAVVGTLAGTGGVALGGALSLGAASPALGLIFGVLGNRAGEWLGGKLFDLFYPSSKPKATTYSDRVMAPSIQGVTGPEKPSRYIMGTPVPDNPSNAQKKESRAPKDSLTKYPEFLKPIEYISPFEKYENFKKEAYNFSIGNTSAEVKSSKSNDISIQVSFSEGAFQVNNHKDELDINELSKITAQKLANEIRLAMQNVS